MTTFEIRSLLQSKTVFFFGIKKPEDFGLFLLKALGMKLMGYIDNDIEKQKYKFMNYPVYSVEAFNEIKTTDAKVLITVKSEKSAENIARQLEETCGMNRNKDFFYIKIDEQNINDLTDEEFLKLEYMRQMGKELNLKNPVLFSEKLQWLKLYDRKPVYTKMADKFEARKFISGIVGDEYLTPLLGVWDRTEDIDFESLPQRFVLKCNHDSGGYFICEDKQSFDIAGVRRALSDLLRRNYFWHSREWQYKNIEPKILAEEYLTDEHGELLDYKLMCFNGKVRCTYIRSGQNADDGLKITFFDNDWNRIPVRNHYPSDKRAFSKPINFGKMIDIAEKLSKGISFLRVDFYEIDGKLYIGEMTFHEYAGFNKFDPFDYEAIFGEWINLKELRG